MRSTPEGQKVMAARKLPRSTTRSHHPSRRPPPLAAGAAMMRPRRGGAAALLLLALAACTSGTDPDDRSSTPAAGLTSPVPTPSDQHTATDPVQRSDQITSAEQYLGEEDQGYDWRDFNPGSGTALLVIRGDGPMEGLAVLGRRGPVATLVCGRDLPCSTDVATLGPGADEVTIAPDDRTAQVIGYDGALRRTIDLSATVTRDGRVQGLRWSPDGSRLAVLTEQLAPRHSRGAANVCRVWLIGRQGGAAQLAYSLLAFRNPTKRFDSSESEGRGIIWFPGWSWSWSPDGQALLLDALTGGPDGTADRPVVVVLRLHPDGAADQVTAQTLYHSDRSFDSWGNLAWSPDGTRIAVRTKHHITEISAEDGSVVAQHADDSGWVIWPARQP